MESQGVNELLERVLGLEGLSVLGASLQHHGLEIQVRPQLTARRCGICNDFWRGYDQLPMRRWRHLSLERTPVWLSYATRRVKCPNHGVRVERVPWATHGSFFTTELEQMMPWLSHRLGRPATCRMLGLSWHTAERLLHRPVVLMPDLKRIEERYVIGANTLSLRCHSQDLATVMARLEVPGMNGTVGPSLAC
ncbi:helix-turn-helix domain-containing protein [Archangium lansingense]|uniref:helix-turn-helix domain-containing protein n=1 Tax=Archangium lansingense TaxID=2995310 RepID=UPI003B7D3249